MCEEGADQRDQLLEVWSDPAKGKMLFQGLDAARKQAMLYSMMAIAKDDVAGNSAFSMTAAGAAPITSIPASRMPAQYGGMFAAAGAPSPTVPRTLFQSPQGTASASASLFAPPAAPPAPVAQTVKYAPISDTISFPNGTVLRVCNEEIKQFRGIVAPPRSLDCVDYAMQNVKTMTASDMHTYLTVAPVPLEMGDRLHSMHIQFGPRFGEGAAEVLKKAADELREQRMNSHGEQSRLEEEQRNEKEQARLKEEMKQKEQAQSEALRIQEHKFRAEEEQKRRMHEENMRNETHKMQAELQEQARQKEVMLQEAGLKLQQEKERLRQQESQMRSLEESMWQKKVQEMEEKNAREAAYRQHVEALAQTRGSTCLGAGKEWHKANCLTIQPQPKMAAQHEEEIPHPLVGRGAADHHRKTADRPEFSQEDVRGQL